MNKALGIAALVIIAVLSLAIWLHGNARYAEGKADAKNDCNVTATTAATESAKQLEKTVNETSTMSDSDIDADLRSLGIMRQPADR